MTCIYPANSGVKPQLQQLPQLWNLKGFFFFFFFFFFSFWNYRGKGREARVFSVPPVPLPVVWENKKQKLLCEPFPCSPIFCIMATRITSFQQDTTQNAQISGEDSLTFDWYLNLRVFPGTAIVNTFKQSSLREIKSWPLLSLFICYGYRDSFQPGINLPAIWYLIIKNMRTENRRWSESAKASEFDHRSHYCP